MRLTDPRRCIEALRNLADVQDDVVPDRLQPTHPRGASGSRSFGAVG